MSTYHYELIAIEEGTLGRCIELGVEAIGTTADETVANLRRAVTDKLGGSEAIAPPPAAAVAFELVPRTERPAEPSGPGDTRASLSAEASVR